MTKEPVFFMDVFRVVDFDCSMELHGVRCQKSLGFKFLDTKVIEARSAKLKGVAGRKKFRAN